MINEEMILKKVAKLHPADRIRVAKIFHALSQLIEAMISCQGPDDAKIATVCAITTVFGMQVMPDPRNAQVLMAQTMIDFIIDALMERRKRAEKTEAKSAV
jgi:hypothetical protein